VKTSGTRKLRRKLPKEEEYEDLKVCENQGASVMQSKGTQHTSHQPPQFSVGWSSSGTAQHLADKSSEPQQH
jgi:hypothetical protein